MKREKKTVIAGVTREAMEDAFSLYAAADARITAINADMDGQMTKIRDKYADELARREAEKAAAFEIMNVFALEHREELFTKQKSIKTTHGTIGFRTGKHKLKLKRGLNWPAVIELLRRFGSDYIRTTEEPDKARLLADRDDAKCAQIMADCGIEVVQDETFYVEPKTEEIE